MTEEREWGPCTIVLCMLVWEFLAKTRKFITAKACEKKDLFSGRFSDGVCLSLDFGDNIGFLLFRV